MKNSTDTIGNRTRDLPTCSAVPNQLRYRVPRRGKGSDIYMMSVTGFVFSNSVVRMRIFIHSSHLHTFRAF